LQHTEPEPSLIVGRFLLQDKKENLFAARQFAGVKVFLNDRGVSRAKVRAETQEHDGNECHFHGVAFLT
jgi:hypothetical protein